MSEKQIAPEDEIHIFADGGCSAGTGSWAFLMRHLASGKELEKSGEMLQTTARRMELEAVVQGLVELKRECRVEVFIDSEYVSEGIPEMLIEWKSSGWKRKVGGKLVPVENAETWMLLDGQLARHSVKFTNVNPPGKQ